MLRLRQETHLGSVSSLVNVLQTGQPGVQNVQYHVVSLGSPVDDLP